MNNSNISVAAMVHKHIRFIPNKIIHLVNRLQKNLWMHESILIKWCINTMPYFRYFIAEKCSKSLASIETEAICQKIVYMAQENWVTLWCTYTEHLMHEIRDLMQCFTISQVINYMVYISIQSLFPYCDILCQKLPPIW